MMYERVSTLESVRCAAVVHRVSGQLLDGLRACTYVRMSSAVVDALRDPRRLSSYPRHQWIQICLEHHRTICILEGMGVLEAGVEKRRRHE